MIGPILQPRKSQASPSPAKAVPITKAFSPSSSRTSRVEATLDAARSAQRCRPIGSRCYYLVRRQNLRIIPLQFGQGVTRKPRGHIRNRTTFRAHPAHAPKRERWFFAQEFAQLPFALGRFITQQSVRHTNGGFVIQRKPRWQVAHRYCGKSKHSPISAKRIARRVYKPCVYQPVGRVSRPVLSTCPNDLDGPGDPSYALNFLA